jgi:hypothetical protein
LVIVLLAGTLGRVIRRPFWHDEIFTLYVATKTSVEGLWAALATGVDLNPPLYYLAVRAFSAVFGAGEIATRLPSTLGFLGATVCLYAFMRRRVSAWLAMVAALTMPLTSAFMYSYEGRAYGAVLGLSAGALVAWQARGDGEWRRMAPFACALALAGAVFTHYYAVLMVLPLAAGELARVVIRRGVDWIIWIALTLGVVVPLVALRPLIAGARQYASTFWSAPTLDKLTIFYRELLDPLALLLVGAMGVMALAAVLMNAEAGEPRPMTLLPDEIVAALALALLPVAGYALALFTGAFHGRYVIQSVLGVSILVAWGAATLVTSRRSAIILVGVLFLGVSARQAGGAVGLLRGPAEPLAEDKPFLSRANDGKPLVISHVLDFLPIAHYSTRAGVPAPVYLTERLDPGRGHDTADRAMRLLARYASLDVQDFDTFARAHGEFYVYGRRNWLVPLLISDGATVTFLGEHETAALYAVTPSGSTP